MPESDIGGRIGLNFRASPRLIERLDRAAADSGLSRGEACRAALLAWIEARAVASARDDGEPA